MFYFYLLKNPSYCAQKNVGHVLPVLDESIKGDAAASFFHGIVSSTGQLVLLQKRIVLK
jgi:hypothetical protein